MAIVTDSSAPGVYVEEQDATGPIAGAGTSTAAFIGKVATLTGDDKLDVPALVTNWTGYQSRFGGLKTDLPLSFAVRGFFENGGTTAYVVPVEPGSPPEAAKLAKALDALTRLHDVQLVCLPGIVDGDVQAKIRDHCENMRNRFAVLDGVQVTKSFDAAGELLTQRGKLTSKGGYAAVYWPWIVVDDPTATDPKKKLISVPPSGHVAGIMARSDAQYGVHKAPANETVRGARALDVVLNDTEQGLLNKAGVNAIRLFPGRPPTLWGARTTTVTTEIPWRFVNVRRLVAFIEDSIQQSVRWAVFAPNGIALWKQLDRTIAEFLTRVWQSGALFGRTAAEAFYVKVDEELNPASVRAQGQVVVEIGLAPVRPAEFVVLRFGLWDGPDQAQG